MMLASLVVAASLCATTLPDTPAAPAPRSPVTGHRSPVSDSLAALWNSARPWARFLSEVRERRNQWVTNDGRYPVPDSVAARARAVGRWKVLIITLEACGDAVNVVPAVAHLVASAPNLELRIVSPPDPGRWVMEAHRTPDGRAATPLVLVLDERDELRGCFIERPADLQRWYLTTGKDLDDDTYTRQKVAWYQQDEGRRTFAEVLTVLEAAAAGRRVC